MPILNHDNPDDIVHEQVEQDDENLSQAMKDCIAWLEDDSSDQSSPVWNEGI